MRYFISFLLLLLVSIKPAHPQWTQSKGLWGADISSMITTDSAFLIYSFGNNVHLYKSNQLGWEEKNAVGFDFFKIGDVLFSQDFYNIYRSMDNGETWQILPVYADSFFRGTATALFMPGLFRSYDYGETWEDINDNAGLGQNDHYIIESWKNALFVESVYDSIFQLSYDDGEVWITMPLEGLPLQGYFEIYKYCTQNDEIWLSTNRGIYRLPENGSSWIPSDTSISYEPGVFFEFHDTLFIGTRQGCHYFIPEDSNWVPMNNGLKNPQVSSFTSWKDTLYCSSYPGIYHMGPGGQWTLWNSELSWVRLYSIFAHDSDMWVKTIEDVGGPWGYHLFRSFDNGENFIELDSGWVLSAKQTIMTDSLYYLNRHDGFYVSEDQGDSWEAYNDGLDTLLIYSIAISPQYCYAGTPAGLYFTSNPPAVWHRVPNPLGTASVGNLAVNESIIICNASIDQSSYSMMRSEDGGLTFEPLCIDYDCSSNCNNVYHAPNFFSLGWDSSYYSDETGSEWHNIPITSFIGYPSSFSPGENCLLVAGGYYENRIDISYNMGSDWTDISAGLPPAGSQFPIDNAIINGQRIFTEVEYKGLWYRDDLVTFTEENEIKGSGGMEVWPNPFTHDFNIKLNLPVTRIYKLRLYDLQGRLIYQENELPSSLARIHPPSCIGPGMYVLQVFTGEGSYSAKLIKK